MINITNEEQKSSKVSLSNILNSGNFTEIAKFLVLKGFTPIPVRLTDHGLHPLVKWRNFELQGTLQEKFAQVVKLFSKLRKINGIAIKCGKASNIIILDIDDPDKFNSFYPLEKLKQQAGYIVRTRDEGHFHIGFLYDTELKSSNFLEQAGFEIKSDSTLATIYSTVADYFYTIVKLEKLTPLPQDLKEKIKELMTQKLDLETELKPEFNSELKPKIPKKYLNLILEKLKERYIEPYKRQGRYGPAWRTFCPNHNDEEASLDVELINERVQLKCWAGCKEKAILTALDLVHILQENQQKSTIEETLKEIEKELQNAKGEKEEKKTTEEELIDLVREIYRTLNEEKKKTKVSVALSLALLRKCSFWMSEYEEAYISLNDYTHMKLESKVFKDFLQDLAIKASFQILSRDTIEEIVSFGRHYARASQLKYNVFTRVGYSEQHNFIEVNLLREDNKVLRISKDTIELDYPRLKFVPSKTQLPLRFNFDLLRSMQNKNFTANEIFELFSQVFNIQTKEELALLIAWAIKTFYPIGEYPILGILGEREGVGKTTFSKFLAQLLDPTTTPLKSFPRNRDDLFVLAKENFLLVFDNLSYIDEDMSDALCQLATGGSLSKRKLYTDYEVIDMTVKRPVVNNSIFNVMQRRDLRRRSIVLELKKPKNYKSLKQLQEDFDKLAPLMYSYFVLCVQEALKEKTIELPLLDLADFCEWVAKAHPVFFMNGNEFIQTLKANREEIAKEVLESSLLVPIIEEKTATLGIWQTTAKELLEILRTKYPNEKSLPSTVEKLGRELKKIASDLETLSIKVEFIRTSKKRLIVFYKEFEQPKEPS
jgi:tRNA uridine 5-carbamoylmethylation protein Kti12